MSDTDLLKGLIGCLDLTNLNDDCDSAAIAALCAKAQTPHGNVAAVCIYPRFVAEAKDHLSGTGIKVVTVVNFPDGGEDTVAVEAATRQALADGADEIDLVMAYKALAEGRPGFAETQIVRIKRICGDTLLKVILETGELQDAETIRKAADVALAAGADFLKTSTGKVATNATLDAAEILLTAIAETDKTIGFKPAGGIKTSSDAIAYFDVAKRIRGDAAPNPALFRLGASSVLDAMIASIEGREETKGAGY
ncbi:deoxyribose-phosphate aldolase [Pararhizobium sp. IMCC21322]|uniref:deoxyribose-phosphate aldolase n=1 Tax=Pararhizobium sp. IMCC21322 TaxID=3067903 RepID=UPI002742053D|nr:deoxyribose-phosphate aldolase [Pararhizobium sp. IMCC21322]